MGHCLPRQDVNNVSFDTKRTHRIEAHISIVGSNGYTVYITASVQTKVVPIHCH